MATKLMQDNEQIEADAQEGIVSADEATLELIDALRAVKRRKAEAEAEEKMLADLIKDKMRANNVRHYLDHAGVEVTTLSEKNTSRFNKAEAIKKLGANVIAEFVSTSTSYSLTIKG